MIILHNVTGSKRDIIKAGLTTLSIRDFKDQTINVKGIIVYTDDSSVDADTGEVKETTVTVLKTDKDEFISSISPTIQHSAELLINGLDEKEILEGIDIVVKTEKSSKKREFYLLDLA